MIYDLLISHNGINYLFRPLYNSDYDRVEIKDVVIIDFYKWHNHLYSFKAFFYGTKVIVSSEFYGGKKFLFGAVQNRLKQFLTDVEQKG